MIRPPVVLGLDFGGTKIAVAVGDLSGRRLGDHEARQSGRGRSSRGAWSAA